MKYHEGQQKDESREVYIRRISKFPILSPNTILRAVFPAVRLDTLRYIKDCARSEFPNSFPPEDSKGIPFIDPEDISTKAFAKWVAEENIFQAWIELGEKVSPSAELFIDLVLGKTDNPAHSAKTKANKGRYAKEKEAVLKVAKRLWEEDETLTIADITLHDDINKTTKPNSKNFSEGTLREWIKDLAPSNKPGRRKNK